MVRVYCINMEYRLLKMHLQKNSAFPVLHRISHTRETFFKTPFEVINISNKPNNSAYTAHALRNHLTYHTTKLLLDINFYIV